jgi:hypothetical protein
MNDNDAATNGGGADGDVGNSNVSSQRPRGYLRARIAVCVRTTNAYLDYGGPIRNNGGDDGGDDGGVGGGGGRVGTDGVVTDAARTDCFLRLRVACRDVRDISSLFSSG